MPRPKSIGARLKFAREAAGLSIAQAVRLARNDRLTADELRALEDMTDARAARNFRPEVLRSMVGCLAGLYYTTISWCMDESPHMEISPKLRAKLDAMKPEEAKRFAMVLDMLEG